jgi:serine/threonine protein kinase
MIIMVIVYLDRGYLSPEYASFGHISTAIDTFSFGIVILEIISGRKNIDFGKPEGQHILLQWVHIYSLTSNHPLWPCCGFESLIEFLTSMM